MSAHKRALITLDSAALRRLEELSAQLRATHHPDPALLQAGRQETQAQLHQAATHSQQRQELLNTRLDEQLSGLNAHIKELEYATGCALVSQAQELQSLAQKGAFQGQLADQVEGMLAQQAEHFRILLEQSQAAQQESWQTLEVNINQQTQQYKHQQYSAHQAAVQTLHQTQVLLEGLEHVYPNAVQLHGLRTLLAQAQNNLGAGFPEAAISTAQQAGWQLNEMRLELERELVERNLLHTAALERLRSVQALLVANKEVSAIDLDGRSLDFSVDVDFWTGGGWTHQQQALLHAQDYLTQPAENLTREDLLSLLRSYLPGVEQSVPDLVAQARRNVLASQLRFNMAEAVLVALGEQGFVPAQASYIEGDMRLAYQLALHNLEGSQLVVTLAPQPEGLEHQLDLVSQDQPQRTPHELRQRASELARTLRRAGLQVHSPTLTPDSVREAPAAYRMPPPLPLTREHLPLA